MKNAMLLAYGIFLALTVTKAQTVFESNWYKDTVILKESDDLKVLFIGDKLKHMSHFNQTDSLITMMLDDIKKAQDQGAYSNESMKTHYFIHPEGRRRLKAESADFPEGELNLEEEVWSLNLNLPPYTYIIYDLNSNYQIRIYAKEPSMIWNLRNMHLNQAMDRIEEDKKLQRKFYKVEMERKDAQWSVSETTKKTKDAIELGVIGGISLLGGGSLTPVISIWPSINFSDKYGSTTYKFSMVISQYVQTEKYPDLSFNSFYLYNSYDFLFLQKITTDSKYSPHWLGISGGFYTTPSLTSSPLNGAPKIGLWMTVGNFFFNWDYVRYRKIDGVTVGNGGRETIAFTTRIGF